MTSVRDDAMQVIVDNERIRVVSAGSTGPASLALGAMVVGSEGQVVTVVGGVPGFSDPPPSTPVDVNQTIVGDATDTGKAVATTYIYAEAYGVLSPSTGDATANSTTITTALAEVDGTGATLVFPPFDVPINDYIEVPSYIGVKGGGVQATTFLATDASAGLYFPEPTNAIVENFTFDGNSLATQGIRVGTCNGTHWRNVWAKDVLGQSLWLANVQNGVFDNVQATGSTYGLNVDDGCGSLKFNVFKGTANEYYNLRIGQSGTSGTSPGYSEPTAISFDNAMLEFYSAATINTIATFQFEGGSRIQFLNTNFAHSGTTVKQRVVGGAAEASVTYANCSWIGDIATATAIDASGASCSMEFVGRNIITGALVGMKLNGSCAVRGNPPAMNNVATDFTFSGGAGYTNNLVQYENDERYFQARANDALVMRVKEPSDSAQRFMLDSKGNMDWGGGSGATDVRLYRAITGVLSTESGQMFRAFGGLITATKAGTPTDADTVFDTDGTMIVDTSASKLWIRISGTWKSVTLT